jgi:hypothetical protein
MLAAKTKVIRIIGKYAYMQEGARLRAACISNMIRDTTGLPGER